LLVKRDEDVAATTDCVIPAGEVELGGPPAVYVDAQGRITG
jgi:hypothetical protein